MKTNSKWYALILSTLLLPLLFNCKKETPKVIPTVTLTAVTNITANSASAGGSITADGGDPVTARGVCWSSTNALPTIADNKTQDGAGIGNFISSITGLTPGTTYNIRAYATNAIGTAYGDHTVFNTINSNGILFNPNLKYGSLNDFDGNVYKTIAIGTQVWMAENLKTTKYNDGTAIPLVTDNTAWNNSSTPCYCWYNNDATANKNTYGALYNWYIVNTGKLCPTGWHVPTYDEWTILTIYLGGESVAGGKLKETDTSHWLSPNTDATNTVGFTALPGGLRDYVVSFNDIGYFGYWWSTTEYNTTNAWIWFMSYDSSNVNKSYYYYKQNGLSVRCLKD